MRTLVFLAFLLGPAAGAQAKVLNVEFKFTPFTGDPKADTVETVTGSAHVFLNNVPLGDQHVEKQQVPVLFEDREIAPAVWVNTESLGPIVRKGKNTLRIEFEPEDAQASYRAQLRWASVTDRTKAAGEPGRGTVTNQADGGVDDEAANGRVVMQHDFTADFAVDLPWHHLPPVTSVSDADRQALAALVMERVEWFKPDFSNVYKALAGMPNVDLANIRTRKCVEAAHKAGVHITAIPAGELDVVITGGPEVIVRGKRGGLYPPDPQAFERIKGDEMQMCAGIVLMRVYPRQLVAVRTPGGTWVIVY